MGQQRGTVDLTAGGPSGQSAPGLWRSAAVLAACGIGAARLGHAALDATSAATEGPIAPDGVVAAMVLGLGAVACAVLGVGALLLAGTALARLAGRSVRGLETAAARLTPAVLRRAVAVTLTTGVGLTGAAGAASATEIDLGWEITSQTEADAGQLTDAAGPTEKQDVRAEEREAGSPDLPSMVAAVDPVDPPDGISGTSTAAVVRTMSAPARDAGPVPAPAEPTVTVSRGDSLWTIAAEHLPDGTTDAEIAASWPRWYALNEQVIGADPDLIRPGQQLLVPDGLTSEESR